MFSRERRIWVGESSEDPSPDGEEKGHIANILGQDRRDSCRDISGRFNAVMASAAC